MKQSGPRGVLGWVACVALLINAFSPAAACVGLFDASCADMKPNSRCVVPGSIWVSSTRGVPLVREDLGRRPC
jgi:hypothetical protein